MFANIPIYYVILFCAGAAEEADTLHALNLLQEVMITFPSKLIEESCSIILRVMTVSNPVNV